MPRHRNYIENGNISIPLYFEDSSYEYPSNDRFTIKKCKVMSLESVANGFVFSRQSVENSMKQLDMCPVVGLYNGSEFEGHEPDEVAYGAVIPNTQRFEEIDGKTWLCCDTAIWSERYSLPDISGQNQSMEIVNIKGKYSKEDKVYFVDEFTFDALTIIGVAPAFKGSGFDDANFSDEFEEFKKEFSLFLEDINIKQEKGEDIEMVNKEGHDISLEDKISFTLSHETVRDQLLSTMNPIDEEGCRTFNYCICEVKDNYFVAMDCNTWGNYYRFDYSIGEDGHVSVDMNTKTETFATFMTMEEMLALDKLKADGEKFEEVSNNLEKSKEDFEKLSVKYSTIETEKETMSQELEELKKFKEDKEAEEKAKFEKEEQEKINGIIETFSSKLSAEEINETLGESRDKLSSDEIESKLSVAFAKKELSKEPEKTEKTKTFVDISGGSKFTDSTDRLVEEAKARKLKK